MPPDLTILISALFAGGLGLLWEEYHRRREDQRAERGRCEHVPGDPMLVAGRGPRLYKQFCVKCGAQRHCDAEGKGLRDWEL